MNGDSGSPNYVEYSVVQAPNGKTRRLKAIIVLASVAVALVLFYVQYSFANATIVALPFEIVFIVFGAFQFWKYTRISYDYTIAGGELKMCAVYGNRTRKVLFDVRLSSASAIVAYNGSVPDEAKDAAKSYACVSSMSAGNIVCIVFKDDAGNKCAAYIEAEKKTKSILKFYNSSAYKIA